MIKTVKRIIGLCAITSLLALSITSCQQPTGGDKPPVPEVKELNLTYAQLDTEISNLAPGTYNLTVDTTGVPEDQFKGVVNLDSKISKPSPFGVKLSKAQDGVLFNLTFAFPDNVSDASSCFGSAVGSRLSHLIKSVTITKANKLTYASYMFASCDKLEKVDISKFTNVTHIQYMFKSCSRLSSVDTTPFSKDVTDAQGLFHTCSALTTVIWGDNFKPATASRMFKGVNAINITASADSQTWIAKLKGGMQLTNYTITEK